DALSQRFSLGAGGGEVGLQTLSLISRRVVLPHVPPPSLLHDPPRPRRILHLLRHRHRPPPAVSVATGNRSTCPTRSQSGVTQSCKPTITARCLPVGRQLEPLATFCVVRKSDQLGNGSELPR